MSNIASSSNVRQVPVKSKLTLTPTPKLVIVHGTESKLDAEDAEFTADTSQENKDTDDDPLLAVLATVRRQNKEQRAMIVKLQRSEEEFTINLAKREKLIDENREKLTQLESALEKKNEELLHVQNKATNNNYVQRIYDAHDEFRKWHDEQKTDPLTKLMDQFPRLIENNIITTEAAKNFQDVLHSIHKSAQETQ
jgi:hypothetical protein